MFNKGKQCEDTGKYNQTTCKEAKENVNWRNESDCDIYRDVQVECHKTCGFCGILLNNFYLIQFIDYLINIPKIVFISNRLKLFQT